MCVDVWSFQYLNFKLKLPSSELTRNLGREASEAPRPGLGVGPAAGLSPLKLLVRVEPSLSQ
jgi:hypothetical protein